jgi:hypothetical protein
VLSGPITTSPYQLAVDGRRRRSYENPSPIGKMLVLLLIVLFVQLFDV